MNEWLQPMARLLASKFAWLTHALVAIGAARIVCKPFSAQLQGRLTRMMANAVAHDDPAERRVNSCRLDHEPKMQFLPNEPKLGTEELELLRADPASHPISSASRL